MGDWLAESDPQASRQRRKKAQFFSSDTHLHTCARNLEKLRSDDQLCDVIIEATCSEEAIEAETTHSAVQFSAHKVVLAAASPYFRAMFCGNLKEATCSRVRLQGIDSDILRLLIDYMYSGKIEIDESNVQSLLSTAGLLQLNCIRDACSRFLLDQLDVSNCLGIISFAQIHHCTQLASAAQAYMRKHFTELADTEEFLSLELDDFLEVIKDDLLNVKEEKIVFETAMKWINYNESSRKKHLAQVLCAVRLPLLSDDYLFTVVKEENLIKESSESKDIFLDACRCMMKHEDFCNRPHWLRKRVSSVSQLIMLIGGQAPKAVPDCDAYDPDTGLISGLAPLFQRRCRCGVTTLGDSVYCIGGFNGSARVRSVDVYDVNSDSWMSGPALDARRSTLGVTTYDNIIYAIGGFDGSSGLASAEMLDPRIGSWVPIPSMNTRRSSVGVAALNGQIYAIGGYDGSAKHCLCTIEMYDLRSMKWTMGPSLCKVRSGAGVTVCQGKVIVAGGHEGSEVRSSVEILDSDGIWNYLPDMNTKRRNAGVIAMNDCIYAIGGDDGSDNLETIEMLRMRGGQDTMQWTILDTKLPMGRSYCGVALLPKS